MLLALLLASQAPAPVEAVVFPIDGGGGLAANKLALLNEQLLAWLGKSEMFDRVVGPSDLQAMLNLEQQKIVLGADCDDGSCLSSLGGALGVNYLVNVR